MIQRPHFIFSLLTACLALQGCNSIKKTIGIDRDAPDEFCVTPGMEPLEMPPNFSCLPIPTPGIERPQDRTARMAQTEKLLGSSKTTQSTSPGQSALLEKCGAQSGQDHIRHKVDTEARIEGHKDKPIVEKLGITKPKPQGEPLNPYEEVEELKKKGISTGLYPVPETPEPLADISPQPEVETSALPSGIVINP